jgi:enamine deaminase RidA (YjgF/YER057c/UK114 family)
MRYLFLCLFLGVSSLLVAQQKTHLNPDGIYKPPTYSQMVLVKGGTTIFTAGVVAQDTLGNILGKGDLRMQTRIVFENLQKLLASAGATFKDVVKLNYYVVNYSPEQVKIIREVRADFLSKDYLPASTLAGVQALFHPDVLIEVEAIAVIPGK